MTIPQEVLGSRRMIGSLARNDFKRKFAGSYLGIIWAFVQPVVTVFVYWFVFEKALHAGTQGTKAGITVPYVLWLIAGLVPWFYFSDAVNAGTRALLDYSYLVKKVVFKISALPVVKVISSLFVHLFFIAFTLVMYAVYHFRPTLYMLQILYYSVAMILIVTAIVYWTSSIVIFFRDLQQIVNIVLQIGVWFTPIMWNIDAMQLPGWVMTVLKLNPMFYIVMGYRDALINDVWFWQRPGLTAYFWILTVLLMIGGMRTFRKLQPHFADVM
ncbi:MAG: ABC transporter permease [Eubacterium sp.]|nr:ABC transporter permease [Eubacterium sp.]